MGRARRASRGATDRRGPRRLVVLAAVAGLIGAGSVACGTLGALHLTVTTAADGRDAHIGDRVCEMTSGAGDCSLRAAIDETNVAPLTFDTIDVAPGIDPTLTLAGVDEDANATGDLDITGWLTLHGGGSTIDGAGLDRVIDHHDTPLAIDHVTITGGEQSGDGLLGDDDEVFVPGNGGFEDGGGLRSTGALTLTDSTISGNHLLNLLGTVDDVRGAGLAVSGGPVHLIRTTIEDNSIGQREGGRGAGLAATDVAELTVTASLVRGNRIGGDDTASIAFGGGIAVDRSTAVIERSTVAGNQAAVADAPGQGAGIAATDSTLTISRSTLSRNSAGSDYTPVDEVWSVGGRVDIVSSTLVDDGPEVSLAAFGGSVGTLTSTVVTGDCAGTFASGGWNVAGPTQGRFGADSCGLTGPTDVTEVPLHLGVLADNGGPTPTHLPGPGSPLVDRIPLATPDRCTGTATDQRGAPVPHGPGCDVGAVER